MSYKNEINNFEKYSYPCFMKVGNEIRPVPELLTESEAIRFLRLDTDKTNDHERTLKHYRDKDLLRPTLIGKNNKYSKKELLRFIDLMTEKTKKRNK